MATHHISYTDHNTGIMLDFPWYGSFIATYLTLRATACNHDAVVAVKFLDVLVYYWNKSGITCHICEDNESVLFTGVITDTPKELRLWQPWNEGEVNDEWDARICVAMLDGIDHVKYQLDEIGMSEEEKTTAIDRISQVYIKITEDTRIGKVQEDSFDAWFSNKYDLMTCDEYCQVFSLNRELVNKRRREMIMLWE